MIVMMAHPKSLLQVEIPGGCHAKTVVGVFEFRGNAGARGCSGDFDVMTPRASARGAATAGKRPLRIPLRGNDVIARVVPIGAPFVHIVANIEESIRIRRI